MNKCILFFILLITITSCQNSSNIDQLGYNDSSGNVQMAEDHQNYSLNETDPGNSPNAERVNCPRCYGEGMLECDDCHGRGRRHCSSCDGDGWDNDFNKCLNCEGSGIVDCLPKVECNACEGSGFGYLEPCPLCKGTAKNNDGEPCTCTSIIHDAFGNFARMLYGELGDEKADKYLKGLSMPDHPGYLFFPPPSDPD